ncbi:M23 family metallopeptidase [Novosphingobium flavum]|uniref:M23 family metallopeptidase n=1 Tax=Novosphingobium flavum TaxID=1778672 RepID=A0A7X1FVP0_9SPHN|nr:M23 family metallopeptidase [Novosphingobium flavum]MBC2667237.1 M23 family metallopeptidase [Novosphingobium flavum]
MKRTALLLAALPLLLAAGKPARKPAPEPDWTTVDEYNVRPGETLAGIARKVEVPRVLIIEANALKAPYVVKTGQALVIPRRRERTVKPGETGFAIAYDAGVPWPQIATANGLDPKARVRAGQKLVIPTLASPGKAAAVVKEAEDKGRAEASKALLKAAPTKFVWPLSGEVRRGFIARDLPRSHDGIDIPAAKGAPVSAAAPGRVVFAAPEPKSYGNLVILEHGKGWYSAYAKLSRITVKKGEKVGRGERLGLVGDTGISPGTELHFEIRRKAVPLDPLLVLPEQAPDTKP